MQRIGTPPYDIDIEELLARHRATFGDARMDADPPADPPTPPADAPSNNNENGFPPNTPLEQMTVEQRESYWKFQARKHEDRVKSLGGMTAEQVKELRDKASKHDALERELMSDKDKAVAEAKETAEREANEKFAPKLVRAEFRAALKGRVADDQLDERLTTITDPLDLAKFLTSSGDVDTDKVTKFVEGITTAPGNNDGAAGRKGPSSNGQGRRDNGGGNSSPSVATGRELYQQRHRRNTAAAQ